MSESDGPKDGDEPETGDAPADAPKRTPPPREELYQALWLSYRDGVREKRALMRAHSVGWALAHTAVELGWPEEGWPSLRQRAELWDRQREAARVQAIAQADARAAEEAGRAQALSWHAFRPRAAALAVQGQALLEQLSAKLGEAAKAATFVKYRHVQELDPSTGRMVRVSRPYVDGVAVAYAARLWAAAFKETGHLMAFLTGQAPDVPVPELTSDQVEQIRKGQLPPGLTLEMVAAAVAANQPKEGTER